MLKSLVSFGSQILRVDSKMMEAESETGGALEGNGSRREDAMETNGSRRDREMIGSRRSTTEERNARPRKRRGGWRAIKYILGNESFERLASMSLAANITLYLREKYNMSGIVLINVVSIWGGTTNIASLAGAFVSDALLGRYLTLLFGSIFSLLGMGTMTLTAAMPRLRPPACNQQLECVQAEKWQLGILFGALGLLAIGAGGLRPCGIAFGADQFDTTTEKGRKQLQSFFNWWYFSFTVALLIALTGVVYVQTNVSWVIGFAIPTACLASSIFLFLIGQHTYVKKKPNGSIFSDMFKVMIAASRKRNINVDVKCLYYNEESESKLHRTDRFKWLDKAAIIVDSSDINDRGNPKNQWRLCNIQHVEQLKCIIGVLPVWVTGVGCMLVIGQQSTYGILQAIQMDRQMGRNFTIPPGWIGEAGMIALSIWIFSYEQVYIPTARKLLKRDSRLTLAQRISIGIFLAIVCMVVSGVIEKMRRDSALSHGTLVAPMSVLMLLPQFILGGLTEAFDNVAMMEFFTIQMPDNMRTVAGAIFFITLSIASYLNSLIVTVMDKVTRGKDGTSWLSGHDLNKNRLEYYYYLIAGMEALNLIYFKFVAKKYMLTSEATNDEKKSTLEISVQEQEMV